MRRNRIIWLIIWILSILSISFYGGTVSYSFFYAASLVPIVSLLYLLYVFTFFHIYQKVESRTIIVDQPIPFYFRLVNEYFLSFVGVRVKFYSSFSSIKGLSDDIEYELLPNTEIKKETNLVCKYRGQYDIGIKTVEIEDYLRLFKLSYHNRESLNVIVYPKLVHLNSLSDIDISYIMNESRYHKTELDILTREYVTGDDLRLIHWANSAKNHELMTRESTGEEQEGVSIILDTMRYSSDNQYYLPLENKMLEIVLAISLFLTEKNILTREYHCSNVMHSNIVQNKNQFDNYYQSISSIEFSDLNSTKKTFEMLLANRDIFRSHTVFFVIHTWNDETANAISKLSESNIYVLVYIVNDSDILKDISHQFARVKLIQINPKEDLKKIM